MSSAPPALPKLCCIKLNCVMFLLKATSGSQFTAMLCANAKAGIMFTV